MPVFNAYFKVIKRNAPSMIIYFVVFVMVSILAFSALGSAKPSEFSETKTKLALFNDDRESALIDGLREYLSSHAQLVDLPDDRESIEDAMFFGNIEVVVRIPAGFTERFLSGSDMIPIQKTAASMTGGSISADLLLNKYLSLVRLYSRSLPGITEGELAGYVKNDLELAAQVDFKASDTQVKTAGLSEYFRYLAYPMLAIMLMGITSIMLAFNEPQLMRRNQCAPLSPYKTSFQMFLGNAVFAGVVWLLLCMLSLGLNGSFKINLEVVLFCLNALAFTIVCLSIGFLAGKFIRSQVVQAAFTNIISLCVCFLSGIFIDQALLGDKVLKIASFTPGYWYVRAVNSIREMASSTGNYIEPIAVSILIQLGFAAAFIILAMVASKQKRASLAG
jgi:ABC-2 type transport system permease protein